MKDLTKSMEMTEKFDRDDGEAAKPEASSEKPSKPVHDSEPPAYAATGSASAPAPTTKDTVPEKTHRPTDDKDEPLAYAPPESNPYAQERPAGIPLRPALMDKSEEEARNQAAGVTDGERELREKQKKKGLTKEQRDELLAYEAERDRIRKERVDALAKKLVDRLSLWTETDKNRDVTDSFRQKIKYEIENLKMESFGIEILHAIGYTYTSKGSNFLKSKNFFGISGFFGRIKDKGNMVKDVWGTISSAMDAQATMEEMAKAEERGGESWTDEARADYERRLTGKILAAAWRGSKFEIQSVLRDVCDQVLHDKSVKESKRAERAQALVLVGSLMKEAQRSAEEENEYMVFEQLMAEAAKKKEDKEDKKRKKAGGEKHAFGFGHGKAPEEGAAAGSAHEGAAPTS